MRKATYPGMNLRGEVRESISLDEDDLSDVEDEVFIRDGKNGYKLAEELNVKRPLMAPRRKSGKSDLGTRLKNKPPCKEFCKPCCYVLAALSVLIGLIVLVVILVSMYPLPLDRLRDWLIRRSATKQPRLKLLPCNNIRVTDVWSVSLPKLTTDSPIRTLDVNNDSMEDILFGFGTGDNSNLLPPDVFCPMFMGVPPPCEGGIIALDGVNGNIIWRHWLNDTIFSLHCTADVNGDTQNDCLAVGVAGTIATIDTKNGTTIWQLNTGKMNVYVANFIPDQDNDSIPDVIASHSSLNGLIRCIGHGSALLISFGSHNANLTCIAVFIISIDSHFFKDHSIRFDQTLFELQQFKIKPSRTSLSNQTKLLYTDKYKGILTQSILVDITGDNVTDIVTAMYNSTVVAINGKTFEQIWNYTLAGPFSETNIVPTPGYFNLDNVTDFLIIYQKYDDIFNYNYTQTFIIDGKTGESIYSHPISGGVITQMGGITLSMESHGYDMYLYWTAECTNIEMFNKVSIPKGKLSEFYDECRRQFNTTRILRLNALNQFHEPPGFMVYNSVDRIQKEFNNTKSAMKQVREYYRTHPKIQIDPPGQTEVNERYNLAPLPIGIRKYGVSSFRHKDGRSGIIKDYMGAPEANGPVADEQEPQITDHDYEWQDNQPPNMLNNLDELEPEFNNYPIDDTIPYNQKHLLMEEKPQQSNNRDPRSKDKKINSSKTLEPASKFEQRDVNSHNDKIREHEEIQRVIEEEKAALENNTFNLWDLESEKEMQDWESGNYRGKREVNYTFESVTKITSVGAILSNSKNVTNNSNSIEIAFITYWQPATLQEDEMLKQDIQDCIKDKFLQKIRRKALSNRIMPSVAINLTTIRRLPTTSKKALFKRECLAEQTNIKNDFNYFNQLYQLRLGQMTVYRLKIECDCIAVDKSERCAKFLPKDEQSWPSYLGKYGDGIFFTRV
ncbi:hypothetical protein NQ318_009731 [Aromia moschata]|uniref:FAM234A/B beta-propeller domain-containing protein n=1 Tax=Aromia moschata TaxID=1265417 RepID=A0AAV8Y298_9CUCU|nr:hypothetical protein NQ318_009731 [Aromia moschata]